MTETFIGRQAILDAQQNILGYELLFRHDDTHNFAQPIDNGDEATSQVMVNSLMNIGLDELVNNKPAFINFTRTYLSGDSPIPFDPRQVILEVLETVDVDDNLVEHVAALHKRGYRFALDDFDLNDKAIKLVPYADFIKLDIKQLTQDSLKKSIDYLRTNFPSKKLVAEKVETHEDFDLTQSMGFDFFQGHFYAKPNIIRQHKITSNQIVLLDLLAKLQNPDIDINKIVNLISQDVATSYLFLRYINSALFAIPNKIASIQHAVTLLGQDTLRKWITVLTISRLHGEPNDLMTLALIRAKFCELLANELYPHRIESYFLVGLFSVLPAMLHMPMNEILQRLPLTMEVNQALLNRTGPSGDALQCALAFEGESGGDFSLEYDRLTIDVTSEFYQEAIRWAIENTAAIPRD